MILERRRREMVILIFRKLIHSIIVTAVFVSLLLTQARAQTIVANNPPFVTVMVIPTEGFVNETFSIYVTTG